MMFPHEANMHLQVICDSLLDKPIFGQAHVKPMSNPVYFKFLVVKQTQVKI